MHQHDAFDDVVVVVLAGDAQPWLGADADLGHVAEQNRRAVRGPEHGPLDLACGMDQADAADDGRLGPEVHRLAADVDVGVVQGLQHLRQGHAEGDQLLVVDRDVVGAGLAAPAGDVDDPGHGLEAALQHPVLQGLQVGHRIAGRSQQAVAVDLADRALGRKLRLGPVGQAPQLAQAVDHPLLGLVVGEVVGELHLHVGQTEQGDGPHAGHVRDAGHLHLDGDGDVALDLLGRLARALGHHLDQRRHGVGVGLDVQPGEADGAGGEQHRHEQGDEPPLLQGEADDRVHVASAQPARTARSRNRAPDVATWSPGLRPSSTSTRPPELRPSRTCCRARLWPGLASQTWAL